MTRESFLERANRNAKKSAGYRRSKKQEREVAKRGNGRLTIGSGSKHQKGDIAKYNGILRIECKTTQKKSFSITREMISKIEDAALPNNELPAIIIEFLDDNGKPVKEVAVIPSYVLDSIL